MEESQQHSVVEGQGALRTTSGTVPVHYRFDVYRHVATQQGFVIGKGLRQTIGTVQLINDSMPIPDGAWNLDLATGERWALLHEDGQWTRVADAS
jgi:hypothetical protein